MSNLEIPVTLLQQQEFIYEDDRHEQANQSKKGSGGMLLHFIKQLSPGLDLTKVSSPSFLLKPVSFLEMQANYSAPILDILAHDINTVPSSVCMLRVLKWLLSSWSLTATRKSLGLSASKPYNPILGEQFHCYWMCKESNGADNITEYHAEQVSHHPPACAFTMFNRQRKFIYTVQGELQSQFKGNSVEASFTDSTGNNMYFAERGEQYQISLPRLTAHGLIFGSSRVEHTGSATIRCNESGMECVINFDKNNRIDGHVVHVPSNTVLYKINGDLSNIVYYSECCLASSGASSNQQQFTQHNGVSNQQVLLLDTKLERAQALPKIVRPVCEQGDKESRRVWHAVTYALIQGDTNAATVNKNLIEEEQRRQRDMGVAYTPQLFVPDPMDNTRYTYYIPANQLFLGAD